MILFIGRFFPRELLKRISNDSRSKVGMSNHNFEMSIVNGLCKQEGIDLKCLTIPGVFSFPHNNRTFYTKSESYDHDNTHIISAGFCNLVFVKELYSTISLSIKLIQLLSKTRDERVDIIVNTPNNSLLNVVKIAKLFTGKRITQTVIIPDIPSMVTSMDKQNPLKALLLKHLNRSSMSKTSKSDGLVLLTEAMMDFIDRPVRHIVMEGIVDVETMDVDTDDQMPEKKVVLYTGTLRKIFGVMNLVKAFQSLENTDAELWICGSGDSENDINEAAKQDSRIKYFGMVDSQTALSMQRQATVLVNPRTSEGEYTKYSFPSKTMEYLLAGKCTIINRLPGIPEEYYDYVYTPDDESVESLAECISDVLSRDADILAARAKAGRDFVTSQKNSVAQTKRIIDMINIQY